MTMTIRCIIFAGLKCLIKMFTRGPIYKIYYDNLKIILR